MIHDNDVIIDIISTGLGRFLIWVGFVYVRGSGWVCPAPSVFMFVFFFFVVVVVVVVY